MSSFSTSIIPEPSGRADYHLYRVLTGSDIGIRLKEVDAIQEVLELLSVDRKKEVLEKLKAVFLDENNDRILRVKSMAVYAGGAMFSPEIRERIHAFLTASLGTADENFAAALLHEYFEIHPETISTIIDISLRTSTLFVAACASKIEQHFSDCSDDNAYSIGLLKHLTSNKAFCYKINLAVKDFLNSDYKDADSFLDLVNLAARLKPGEFDEIHQKCYTKIFDSAEYNLPPEDLKELKHLKNILQTLLRKELK